MTWIRIKPKITISDYFKDLADPRIDPTKQHLLIDQDLRKRHNRMATGTYI